VDLLLSQIPLRDFYSFNKTIVVETQHHKKEVHFKLVRVEAGKFILYDECKDLREERDVAV